MSTRQAGLSRPVRIVLGTAAVVLSGLVAFLVTVNRTSVTVNAPPPSLPAAREVAIAPTAATLVDIALGAMSRTVTVESLRPNDEGLGTAWLIDAKGDFATNAHVVSQHLAVRLRERNGHAHAGVVVAVDIGADIAVVRSQDGFTGAPLPMRSTAFAVFPQAVVAIASSAATGHSDITAETATGIAADVPVSGDTTTGQPASTPDYHDMLVLYGQAIYPGNSGGPVLDGSGSVIGIVTLASRTNPEGYAIPINRVAAELLAYAAR
ncbi:MAG: serine protease [Candidatus Dormibacteraeota bacterium]|nr:serine protease [Candidatus Dormibacteraeota bacterium]